MKSAVNRTVAFYLLTGFVCAWNPVSSYAKSIQININESMQALLQDEDTDNDKKITRDDFLIKGTTRGDQSFTLRAVDGDTYDIHGTYQLSNCLQELTLLKEQGLTDGPLDADRIFENPVTRISRMIRDYYWQGLTRRVDADHLAQVIVDPKLAGQKDYYLYIPANDDFANQYFSGVIGKITDLNIHIIYLPEKITPDYIKNLEDRHGLLPLALRKTPDDKIEGVPFVVPGGRFNEMYGWDSYFEALGLIADGKVQLAKDMVDNFVYQINHYGKILNANRTYYLTRSQPPFLTSMALAVFDNLPKNEDSKTWLKTALLAAIKEYQTVWMDNNHTTPIGLNRYYGSGLGVPPEVEPGHFDAIFTPWAEKDNLPLEEFIRQYKRRKIECPQLDTFFIHDRAVRESGHDTTYRWRIDGKDSCADFATVDLNSLLYKYEIDIAFMLREIFIDTIEGQKSSDWTQRAQSRKELILKYLWDPDKKLFFDYYLPKEHRFDYISATTLYPLWACRPDEPETRILTDAQADALIQNALQFLEAPGGILSTAKISLEKYGDPAHQRQWDYPSGWPPHQMLAWQALHNYNHKTDADRLMYKWLYMIARNAADYNGTIPEKFDVVKRSHAVFAEYGNVGTEFSYMTKEGFGWMNASYQAGLRMLSDKCLYDLEKLTPPEWLELKEQVR